VTRSPGRELEVHRRRLWGLCYGMTGSAADADDLVQETFVRALDRTPEDGSRPLEPWLVTVALNLARDALRKRRRTAYVGPWLPDPVDEELAPAIEIEGEGGTEARYAIVERLPFAFLVALEALTQNQRAVLVLREVLDLSIDETAQATGLSPANVKVLLHRARKALEGHRSGPPRSTSTDRAALAVQRLALALSTNDLDGVLAVLATDVESVSDGGGEVYAALNVVRGPDHVARLFLGLTRRRLAAATGPTSFEIRVLGGSVALVAELPDHGPREATRSVLLFDVDDGGAIRRIWNVLPPRKLAHVRFPAVSRSS
jgi:RNA polymerase sigma-70 factor (ECF subfamily)